MSKEAKEEEERERERESAKIETVKSCLIKNYRVQEFI